MIEFPGFRTLRELANRGLSPTEVENELGTEEGLRRANAREALEFLTAYDIRDNKESYMRAILGKTAEDVQRNYEENPAELYLQKKQSIFDKIKEFFGY